MSTSFFHNILQCVPVIVCPMVFCTSETAGSVDSCEEEGEEGSSTCS